MAYILEGANKIFLVLSIVKVGTFSQYAVSGSDAVILDTTRIRIYRFLFLQKKVALNSTNV